MNTFKKSFAWFGGLLGLILIALFVSGCGQQGGGSRVHVQNNFYSGGWGWRSPWGYYRTYDRPVWGGWFHRGDFGGRDGFRGDRSFGHRGR